MLVVSGISIPIVNRTEQEYSAGTEDSADRRLIDQRERSMHILR